MAIYAELHDGTRLEFPDETSPEVIKRTVKKHLSIQEAPQEPTDEQRRQASTFGRFSWGAAEPIIGAAQLVTHAIPGGEDIAQSVDDYWSARAKQQKESESLAGYGENGDKFNAAGIVGNVLSPANALLLQAGGPAVMGSASGALSPVFSGDFADSKAGQVVAGGVGGKVAGALVDKALKSGIIRKILPEDEAVLGARASLQADQAIDAALLDAGVSKDTIPSAVLQKLRDEVFNNAKAGKEIDAAAMLRKGDFKALGIQPLQGQITRDPMLYSREQNLRGAVPEINQVLNQQQKALQDRFNRLSEGASENYQAGSKLITSLQEADRNMGENVSNLYRNARESSGKNITIPLQGLAQDYAATLDKFPDRIPAAVKKRFDDYGLLTGKQLKVFDVEEADKVLKLINQYDDPKLEKANRSALSELRNAVKSAVSSNVQDGGVYAPAVKAAAERFKLQDEIPALGAVSNADAVPDNFVSRYIVNGETDEVKRLSSILNGPAKAEAKAQLGAELKRAAYGDTGTMIRPESLARTLRKIGSEKLSAFYAQNEIDDLNRLARVGSYIGTEPSAGFTNRSNTTVSALAESPAIRSLFGDGAVSRVAGAIVKAGSGAVKNQMAASQAMNTNIPIKKAKLTPEQLRAITLTLGASSAGVGRFIGNAFQ